MRVLVSRSDGEEIGGGGNESPKTSTWLLSGEGDGLGDDDEGLELPVRLEEVV